MPGKKSPFRTDLKPLDTFLFGDDDEIKKDEIRHISLEQLTPFKDHPFRLYGEDKMRDMAASVAEHGVMTPLIVRPHPDGEADHYEIISGHNRHEGARRVGLEEVPVIVRDVDDATAIDIYAAARSVLTVGKIPVDENIRAIVHNKSNLAPAGKPQAFGLDPAGGFCWLGDYDITIDELLGGKKQQQPESQFANITSPPSGSSQPRV